MAEFILSAFADEYSSDFDKQLEGLEKNGIFHMEIRGVDGKNISELDDEEVLEVRRKLDSAGIGLSAIGSPIGKISITDDFEPHIEKLRRVAKIANMLGCGNIRMFSFYIPKEKDPSEYRDEVMRRLSVMADVADEEGVVLCHENEKEIYGDTAQRCLDIYRTLGGRIKLIFDTANFLNVGETAYPDAFELLKDHIYYMHVKDSAADGTIVKAGDGIGMIPQTIDKLREYDKIFYLTLEPHLHEFGGFAGLENGTKAKLGGGYGSSEEAFDAAVGAMMRCIGKKGLK